MKELLPCILPQEPVTRPKQFLTKVNKLLLVVLPLTGRPLVVGQYVSGTLNPKICANI